jgi:iron complex outermembrane receptor protein
VLGASWDRRDLALDAEGGGELGYLRLRGSDARSGDYEDGDGNEVHSDYHRWNGGLTVGWTPSERTLVEASGQLSDGEAAYADRIMDGSKFDREALTLRVRQREVSTRVSEIEAQVAWGYVDHVMDNYSQRPFVPSMTMPNPAASNPDRETLAARIAATFELSSALGLVAGLDAHQDAHSIRSSMNQPMMPYESMQRRDDAEFRQEGAFAEATWTVAPGRRWSAGLRADRWEVDDLRDTVRVGMMPVPDVTAGQTDRDWLTSGFVRYERVLDRAAAASDVAVFAGLGHSERTADYWERFGNDKQSPASNSAFFTDPELTDQLDFGLIGTSARSRWSASLFVSRIEDYILIDTVVPNKPANTIVTRNVDARTWGGELEHAVVLADAWTLASTLAYTHGENRTDGGSLAQMPPLEGRLSLTWARDRWSVGGLARAVARQDRVDPGRGNIVGQDIGETAGFTVLSLNGSYRFARALTLSAGVDNLLDDTYAEHLSRAGAMVAGFVQTERVNEPGRVAWLKLDASL